MIHLFLFLLRINVNAVYEPSHFYLQIKRGNVHIETRRKK